MNLKIRPFITSDTDRILEISILAWAPVFESFHQIMGDAVYTTIYPDWITEQKCGVEAACHGKDGWIAWVAERDSLVAGFITYKLNHTTRVGIIGYNAVHPEHQNLGIATRMYELVLNKLKESGMVVANVGTGGDPSHAPARRAYEKVGFRPLPLVNYYKEL